MKSRRSVAGITLSNTVAVASNALWIMFIPVHLVMIGVHQTLVALLFSVSSLMTALFNLVGGRVADSVGRKPTAVVGRLVTSLGAFLVFVSTSNSLLLLHRQTLVCVGYLVLSSGTGFRTPATSIVLMESSAPSMRGRTYMTAERLIPSILPALTVLLGASYFDMGRPELMILIGSIGLVVSGIVLQYTVTETLSSCERSPQHQSRPRVTYEPLFIFLVLAFVFDSMSARGVSWYVPVYIGQEKLVLYGVLVSVSTLVIAGFSYVSGLVVDRWGAKTSLVTSWLALSLTVTLFSHVTHPVVMIVLYSVWVALDTVDTAVPPIIISRAYPEEERATRLGMFRMVVNASLFLGPVASGIVLAFGSRFPFYLKAGLNILAAGVIAVVLKDLDGNCGSQQG